MNAMANNNTAARPTAKVSYRDTLKSMDTEEHIDLAFYRPIGYMWACLAKRLGVTPNAITIASIFLGIGAGIMFYFPDMWLNVIGMLLLIWANSFDSADGQLARMTKQYSRLGRILDGLSGDLWFASIYIAICLRENITSEFFSAHPWVIWVVAVVTGLCHAKQAAAADYYRQFHLYFLKGEEGSELESCDELRSRPFLEQKLLEKTDFDILYPIYSQSGSPYPVHADTAPRATQAICIRSHTYGFPGGFPCEEPPADEVYQHPLLQLACDSFVHRTFPSDAMAIFRIRAYRAQRIARIYDCTT